MSRWEAPDECIESQVEMLMRDAYCAHCFGCPHASKLAEQLNYASGVALNALGVVSGSMDVHEQYPLLYDQANRQADELVYRLDRLTENCTGYTGTICQSPENPDSTLRRAAQRIVGLVRK